MNTFTAVALLAFVAVCFAGGNPGLNNGPEKDTGEPGVVITCPDCPPIPDPDPNCEIKGNDFRGSQHNTAKVWICHGTASETNPYVLINVDDASLWQGHFDNGAPGHGKNNHPDIWPNSQGYDGLIYDCNCMRILPPSPPPPPGVVPEVFTVVINVDHDDTCTPLSNEPLGVCEDDLIGVTFGLVFDKDDTLPLTSCEVVLTDLPPSAYIVKGEDTVGHPTTDSTSTFWTLSCDDLGSVHLVLPSNWDTPISSRIMIVATKPSLADPTVRLTATDYKDVIFKIQPINDPPVIGALIDGVFGSTPSVELRNVWGYKTVLPTLRVDDVDLYGEALMVRISVNYGVLGFSTRTVLVLEHPASETTAAYWAPVAVEARPVGTLLNTFSEVQFRCEATATHTSLEVCSGVLNSLHYLAPVSFSGLDNVRVTVDDLGSSGNCILAGPALWSDCTSAHIDIPIVVLCEADTPLRVWSGEENVYAYPGTNIPTNVPTIYKSEGSTYPRVKAGTTLGKKMAICHGTSSHTNPWNFIVVSENAYYGHFLSRTCKNTGAYDSVDRVRDDYSCCFDSASEAFESTSVQYAAMMKECGMRLLDTCAAFTKGATSSTAMNDCCRAVTGSNCPVVAKGSATTGSGHGTFYHDVFLGDAYRGGNPMNPKTYVIEDCPAGFDDDGEFCSAAISCSCTLVNKGPANKRLSLSTAGLVVIGNFIEAEKATADSETHAAAAAVAPEAPSSADDGSTMWSLVAAALGVAVVGLIVAVVLVRRRRTQKEECVEEAAAPAPAPAAAPVAAHQARLPKTVDLVRDFSRSEVEVSGGSSMFALAAAIENLDLDNDLEESASRNGF